MNIFVCIKQVPSTNKVEVDEKTGVLKRDGVASKMNPYDLYALETALRLKEKHGGKITVGTMGPPQAKEMLQAGDSSMKEICSAVGYSDPNYFSRTFKKNVGVTPTEFKEGK